MDKPADHSLGEQLASALGWWREAGVDGDFAEEPHDWLARPGPTGEAPRVEAPGAKPRPPAIPPLGGDPAGWPDSPEAFAEWWRSLDSPGTGPGIAPRGSTGADLMVLVPMPEEGDGETLLSGPQGRLIANMLSAMGVGEERAYLAAALPRHARLPDWAALAERRLGDVLRHHIVLAAPKRLLVLGRKMLPLLAHDPAQDYPIAGEIALEGIAVPVLAAVGPETLLDRAQFRKALWRAWLDWTEGKA